MITPSWSLSMNKKYAVFTMDVEAFADTECLSRAGMEFEQDMLDGLDAYMEILDRHGIKATMFSVCRTALQAKDRILNHLQKGHELALHSYDELKIMLITEEQTIRDVIAFPRTPKNCEY